MISPPLVAFFKLNVATMTGGHFLQAKFEGQNDYYTSPGRYFILLVLEGERTISSVWIKHILMELIKSDGVVSNRAAINWMSTWDGGLFIRISNNVDRYMTSYEMTTYLSSENVWKRLPTVVISLTAHRSLVFHVWIHKLIPWTKHATKIRRTHVTWPNYVV